MILWRMRLERREWRLRCKSKMGFHLRLKNMFDFKGIDKIFEKIKLGNSFLVFGGVGLLLSVYVSNELGIKIFLLIFIFGGIFRLFNMTKPMFSAINNIFIGHLIRFSAWIGLLIIFAYLANKHITIF